MSEYSFIAPVYDILLYPFLRDIRRKILKIVTDLKPKLIIDVCCGTGSQLRLLKRHGFQGVGIDLSEAMLKMAKKGENAPDCFLQDATATYFENGIFDLAIISFALHETGWENARAILNETHRILKPGGHALVVDYTLDKDAWKTADLLIEWIERLAGRSHYLNFITYKQSGGLDLLLEKAPFSPVFEIYKGYRSMVIKLLKKDRM